MGDAAMTLMTVKGLMPHADRDEAVLMLQTAAGDRVLGLIVPMNEATRLARVLGQRGSCRCSPMYELLFQVGNWVDASVTRAVLDAGAEGIGAQLVFSRAGLERHLDCHPADAVGLAIRAGAPIYATPGAIGHACRADAHDHA